MTDTHIKIKDVVPKVQYTGNGVTTSFPYEFPIFDESDMVVYLDDEIQETGYTVSGEGQTDGGNVTFTTAPADGVKITLIRQIPIERVTDFQEGGTFRPKNLNDEFDRQTAFLQQVQETLTRAVKVGPTSEVEPEEVLTQVERVYQSIDNVDAVADDLTNVNAVAADLINIDAVAGDLTKIDAVADDLTNIDAVNANKTNINAVAGNATNINAVAGNQTNIDAVAGNATNINSVAGNATNINAAVANETNINAAVSNETNINTVAGIASDVSNVASNSSDVSNVATNMSDVNNCATNMAAIQDAPNQAQAAADSAALSAQYANDKINQTHITNCITYIPQDIKLELSNGTLTLKAGSKIYVPNGSGVFDEVIIDSDKSVAFQSLDSDTRMFFYNPTTQIFSGIITSHISSGSSASPSSNPWMWYDTTNNLVKATKNTGSTWISGYSFPICICTNVQNTSSYIDQVFNGYGYIGSTVFALPGVKCLIPNGRNDNGTLKNTEFTVGSVATTTNSNNGLKWIVLRSDGTMGLPSESTMSYDEENNFVKYNNGNVANAMVGKLIVESGVISDFNIKTAFHALDYNDKWIISGWSMPSARYIDLTLGASGAEYKAPANGYVCFRKQASASGQYMDLRSSNMIVQQYVHETNKYIGCIMPVKRGMTFSISYDLGGTLSAFRFVYAEGENV